MASQHRYPGVPPSAPTPMPAGFGAMPTGATDPDALSIAPVNVGGHVAAKAPVTATPMPAGFGDVPGASTEVEEVQPAQMSNPMLAASAAPLDPAPAIPRPRPGRLPSV